MDTPESRNLMNSSESESEDVKKTSSRVKFSENRLVYIIVVLVVVVVALVLGMFAVMYFTSEVTVKQKRTCFTKECIGLVGMMKSYQNKVVDPCDDFFEHVCGRFHEHQSLDKSLVEIQHDVLVNHIYSSVRKTSKFTTHPKEQLRIFAKKCTDRKERFLDNFEELMADIQKNGGFPFIDDDWDEKKFDLSEMLAAYIKINRNRLGFLSLEPFAILVNGKIENRLFVAPGPHWVYNWVMGIDNYRDGVRFMIEKLLKLKNQTLNMEKYNLEFEKLSKLEAHFHKLSNFKNANRGNMENFRNLTDLIKAVPEIDWTKILSAMARNGENSKVLLEKVKVSGEDYFFGKEKELSRIATKTPKSVLANYLVFRHLLDVSLYFYEKDQPGTLRYFGKGDQQSFCAHQLVSFFPMLSQNIFISENAENPSKIKKNIEIAEKIFQSVKAEFHESIQKSTWLDGKTREKALVKLEKITKNSGFQEYFEGRGELERMYQTLNFLETDSSYQIYMKMWRHRTEQLVEHVVLDTSLDPVNLNMFRQHAGYRPFINHLVVMLPYLTYPYLDSEFPASANYGYIGHVFGHEMGHAFDETYRKLDENGKSVNWWSESANAEFKRKEKCVRDQYSEWTEPGFDFKMNGTIPRIELFGDNVGIIPAFRAFQKAAKFDETELPGLQTTTSDQQFFYNYALKFCDVYNPQRSPDALLAHSHPTMRYRVNGVLRNIVEFSDAFECSDGSYMRMKEERRCRIF